MSRFKDLGDILDKVGKRENSAPAPKKTWKHSYETIEGKTGMISMPDEIKGKFVYQDEQNIVKVSYTGCYVEEAPGLSKADDIQVQLYKKETPETLESLVTLKSDEVYNIHRLKLYISQLQEIEKETEDEKNEFKYFRDRFLEGLREVIKKITDGAEEQDPIDNIFGKYCSDIPFKKEKTEYLQNQNQNLLMPGIGLQGGKKYTPSIDYDSILLNDKDKIKYFQENLEKYKNIKEEYYQSIIKKDIKEEIKPKTLEDILTKDIEAINQGMFDKYIHNRDYNITIKQDDDENDEEDDAKDKDSD